MSTIFRHAIVFSTGHAWKVIAFGPDDMLYMSVGAVQCLPVPAHGGDHSAHEARWIGA